MTFDKAIRQRSVSYEGDVFDPAGTMSGGSRDAKQSLLAAVSNLQRIEQTLQVRACVRAWLAGWLVAVQDGGCDGARWAVR